MVESVLAFDFGLKHIGVAVGQSITGTASPLTTLSASNGVPSWNAVRNLVEEWHPNRLLVGLPLNMDNSESDMSANARQFAELLALETGLEYSLVDERLTTFEAREIERTRAGSRAMVVPDNHAIAAQLIAESWLQARANPQRR